MKPAKTLEIDQNVWLEVWRYESSENDVSINYINKATAYGHSDEEKEVRINREQAAKIIEFLQTAFDKEQQ